MDLKILLVGVVFGGFVIAVIWFLYIREVRKSTKLETELEQEEYAKEIIKKQRDNDITNVTDAISMLTKKRK